MNADAGLVAYQASGRLRQIRRFNQLAIVFFIYPPSTLSFAKSVRSVHTSEGLRDSGWYG